MSSTRRGSIVVLGAFLWLLCPSVAQATTWTASQCDNTTIQNLHNNASVLDGDTINVPAGASCTFANHVTVTKCLIIHGAGNGVGGTHLIWSGSAVHYFFYITPGAKTCRFDIGQFWFTKTGGPQTQGYVFAQGGPWPGNIRVHDNRFNNPAKTDAADFAMQSAQTTVIFDHNVVTGEMFGFISRGRAQTDWAITPTWGGSAMNFIEDNTFDWGTVACYSNIGYAIYDAYEGGFATIRYNTVINGFMESHDDARNGLQASSAFFEEVYWNNFSTAGSCSVWKALDLAGGTGAMWNNVFNGQYGFGIGLIDYRTMGIVYFDSPICNGSQSIDQNTKGQTGWRCRYQIGTRGYNPATIAAEPMYIWGNTCPGTCNNGVVGVQDFGVAAGGQASSVHIVLNRDYFLSAKPGYTPYTYPHPNTVGHGGGGGSDTTPPTLTFTSPSANFTTTGTTVPIAGTCADNVACGGLVTWANSLTTGSGPATGVASWTATVPLNAGINPITATNTDAAANTGTTTIDVLRESCGTTLPYSTTFALAGTGTGWPVLPCFTHYGSGARYSITGNQAKIGAASFDAEVYTTLPINANQYIQATIGTVAPLQYQLRLCVRTTGSVGNNADLDAIFVQIDGANSSSNFLSRYDNGGLIEILQLLPGVTTLTANVSKVRLEAEGSIVRAYYDADGPGAGPWVQLGQDQTIVGYAGGVPAICGTGIETTLDDVEIGNFAPPADTTSPSVTITMPTDNPAFVSSIAIGGLAGTASDANGISSCTAANSLGGAIPLTGTTSWSNTGTITAATGDNVITITCVDPSKNSGMAVQHVILQGSEPRPPISLRGVFR